MLIDTGVPCWWGKSLNNRSFAPHKIYVSIIVISFRIFTVEIIFKTNYVDSISTQLKKVKSVHNLKLIKPWRSIEAFAYLFHIKKNNISGSKYNRLRDTQGEHNFWRVGILLKPYVWAYSTTNDNDNDIVKEKLFLFHQNSYNPIVCSPNNFDNGRKNMVKNSASVLVERRFPRLHRWNIFHSNVISKNSNIITKSD